ncbi:hypothetical protein, partial [Heyndrickxia ginsengihumi]|uniref:hypothetical protein n=1 Tax=Heyndrickxia ginsengihumi TaxID=363870 RepID=UPI001E53CACE
CYWKLKMFRSKTICILSQISRSLKRVKIGGLSPVFLVFLFPKSMEKSMSKAWEKRENVPLVRHPDLIKRLIKSSITLDK